MCAMRPLRNFKTNQCCHLISRIANRAFFLNDEEKTRFVERLWRVATLSCVEVLAYCFMSNHFHILVYVPDPRELSDDELLARIRALYSGTALAEIEREWELLSKVGGAGGRERFRRRYLRRMWSASEFMKTLKQTATMSYNGRRVHTGTIWESRFRAKTCEPDEKAELMADRDIQRHGGIYEFLLSDRTLFEKLNLRTFDPDDMRVAYEKQNGFCPVCKGKFAFEEMRGDHIKPWSKGGKTVPDNLQMLCADCNARKSDKF